VLGSNGSNPIFNDCPLDEVFIGRKLSYQTSSGNGYSPFYRNTSLRSIEISDVETEIYDNEFYGCTNLQNVKIGDGVKSFGKYAFSGCSKIDSFEFGRSVTRIGEEAFSDCTAMTSLTSRNPVPPVCGSQALDDINKWDCTLHVPTNALEAYKEAPQWKNFFFIGDDVDSNKYFEYRGLYYRATDYDNLRCEVVAYEDVPAEILEDTTGMDTLDTMEIPSNAFFKGVGYTVSAIGNGAFSAFTDLQEVVIPATMEYLGNEAFAQCPLTRVEVKAITPPVAQEDSFDADVYASAELVVPDESRNEYRTAAVWKNFSISPTLATSITLDLNEKSARVGDEFGLTATVLPEDATDKNVAWSSSDESVATVDADGWVKVVGEGICVITVTTTDGSNLSAECEVNAITVSVEEIFAGGGNVDIYSLTGILVNRDADLTDFEQLTPGIYIVKIGDTTHKIVVK
ncbi:MAG: leucine-rich repeat protein, partial [Muribaculaceae bacterium]|nr:leucine-rich repeat protein [Muribaculaceae bacterium]